jgi:predicted ABC-type ATPase
MPCWKPALIFAFETTLATRSYVSFIKKAKEKGYKITLLYLWLPSTETAVERVAKRVKKGGHNIPNEVIHRRYYRGIGNLLNLYISLCDNWYVTNNANTMPAFIAQGGVYAEKFIIDHQNWEIIKTLANGYSK